MNSKSIFFFAPNYNTNTNTNHKTIIQWTEKVYRERTERKKNEIQIQIQIPILCIQNRQNWTATNNKIQTNDFNLNYYFFFLLLVSKFGIWIWNLKHQIKSYDSDLEPITVLKINSSILSFRLFTIFVTEGMEVKQCFDWPNQIKQYILRSIIEIFSY